MSLTWQEILQMIPALVVFGGAIGFLITAYYQNKKTELEAGDRLQENLLNRITQQDNTIEELNKRLDVYIQERQSLSEKYDTKTAEIRIEMRKIIENSAIEISNWRLNYDKLMDDYQRLKLEHYQIKVTNESIMRELNDLHKVYEQVLAKYEILRKDIESKNYM